MTMFRWFLLNPYTLLLLLGLGVLPAAHCKERSPPLPVADAFGYTAQFEAQAVHLRFQIAPGYHLYRERLSIESQSPLVRLGPAQIPAGTLENDPTFGPTAVLRGPIDILIPVVSIDPDPEKNQIRIKYQGCQDEGSCYPPQREIIHLGSITPNPQASARADASECALEDGEVAERSAQCTVVDRLKTASFLGTLGSFLGMGLLLAFTPCIFPMIPILSGIIAGQGEHIDRQRAFSLSLAYVLASALAYTGVGILAGLFGQNLQATLQAPAVIIGFSSLFALLALSMFGVFSLELPRSLQSYFSALSGRQSRGTVLGAATMGFFSALIVGPCVAAPLAGALIYIGETGDAVLGGSALFALGIGMGLPLLAIGTSAGALLPKAGPWMDHVKTVFGFGLLGVGLELLSRLVTGDVALSLWGGYLILAGMSLGTLERSDQPPSLSNRLVRGLGLIALIQGTLFLVGGASGADDPRHPLQQLSLSSRVPSGNATALSFEPVTNLEALRQRLSEAHTQHQPVLVDFYADWCTACREMDQITYRDPAVESALKGFVRLKADVTEVNPETTQLLRAFRLVGPPATLFFRSDGTEVRQHRIVGFMDPQPFLKQLAEALSSPFPSTPTRNN